MKKVLFGGIFLSLMAISCSKDGDDEPVVSESFLNTKAGSTWNYETTDNANPAPPETYTLTSTSRDTTIGGKTYHIYTNSASSESEYNSRSGNDYYRFQALPADFGGSKVEELYLKSAASLNATWSQTNNLSIPGVPFPISITNVNKIVEKGISKTVNGTAYNNVTHVKTDVSVGGLPPGTLTLTTDIHQYYAPNYGLIESNVRIDVDLMGTTQTTDVSTKLKTATLL